jgi:hypothetical protein
MEVPHYLFSSTKNIRVIKLQRMRRAEHATSMGISNSYRILVEKLN